jgi:hypothetical protein
MRSPRPLYVVRADLRAAYEVLSVVHAACAKLGAYEDQRRAEQDCEALERELMLVRYGRYDVS